MKTLRLACLIAATGPLAAAGCTPPTHHAVTGLGDCVEPPPGVDAAVPRECYDAPSQSEGGVWVDCTVAMYDARPNEPCSFGGGYCGGDTSDRSVSASCIEGRITRFDRIYTAPPDECTPTDFEVAGSCLENGCVSICPGEPVPPTESAVTWNVDDETSCRTLLAEIPQAGEPCIGSGWCQGLHVYEADPGGGFSGDTLVAFCGSYGLAIIRHDEIPGRPFYWPED